MGLANGTTVASNCGWKVEATTAVVTACLPAAEARVLDRIGATIYAAITAAAGAPYTAAAKTAVTRAESLIAGAIVLRNHLNQIGPNGMVGSVLAADGSEKRLATQAQLDAKAAGWEAEAYLVLAPWEALYQEALRVAGDERALPSGTFRAGRLTFSALGGDQ